MTKKEIYAQHGIEYKDGSILFNGEYIPELLKDGNTKLGKSVWTWSMLPGNMEYTVEYNGKTITAAGTCICNCVGCYAQTGFYNMPNTKYSNALKTVIARTDAEFMANAIIAQIHASNIKLVRIHASGDFFSTDYVNDWRRIVRECPNTMFWTYTKNRDAEHAFDDLANINIVKSIIDGVGYNFGHCGYIIDLYNRLKAAGAKVHICRCGIDKNQHCNDCKGCAENDFVLFVEHSTAYKASADARYNELVELIDAQ